MRKLLAILTATMVLVGCCVGCGQKPEPDASQPSLPGDISTDMSSDATGDTTGDATDDTTTGTDVSGDATDDASDSTTGTASQTGDTTSGKSDNKTTGKTSGKTTGKTTGKTSGKITSGILVEKDNTTTTKTEKTTTTQHKTDENVKDKILALFDSSMKGKTVIVLSGWDQGTDEKAKMDELMAATGIKVSWKVANNAEYGTRLSALINASASPDLALLNASGYPSMVIKNFFQDLSVTGIDTTSDLFDQQLMQAFTWNGKQYSLVLKNSEYTGLYFTFYNKSMFSKLGVTDPGTLWRQGNWNWDTFLECARKTADLENNRLGVDFYGAESFLMTSGLPIVTVGDGDITNNLEDPRIVESWTFINKLHHEYKVTAATVECFAVFANGGSAMLLGDSWLANAGDTICSTMTDKWGVVPFPMKKGLENLTPVTPGGGAIPIGARNPKMGAGVWAYWCSYDTGMLGSGKPEGTTGAYTRDEINEVKRAIWECDKIANMGQGVLEYGGEYSHWDFGYEIWYAGLSGVQSSIGKWKGAIDVNIKRIMTEFS
ncbi:MAG: extracellular solute-binding protein [Clostridia bacterium]|nr:extracellular solute-binding protein [Clostridia bacterium]